MEKREKYIRKLVKGIRYDVINTYRARFIIIVSSMRTFVNFVNVVLSTSSLHPFLSEHKSTSLRTTIWHLNFPKRQSFSLSFWSAGVISAVRAKNCPSKIDNIKSEMFFLFFDRSLKT